MLTGDTGTALMSGGGAAIPKERKYENLAEVARECLRASAHRALRFLTCEGGQGILVLRGRVSSYYDKQMAQESVRHLTGIEAIFNLIEVVVGQHSPCESVPHPSPTGIGHRCAVNEEQNLAGSPIGIECRDQTGAHPSKIWKCEAAVRLIPRVTGTSDALMSRR